MTFRTAISLILGGMAAMVIYVMIVLGLNHIKIVEIADWDSGARTLRLAASMPSCACMTLLPKRRTTATRAGHFFDGLKSLRLGNGPLPDPKDIALIARLDGREFVGQMPLKETATAEGWSFAFDWAGSRVDSHYDVNAYTRKPDGTIDTESGPVDMSALFEMSAIPHDTCQAELLDRCPWGDLNLNKAAGGNIGQNQVGFTFTGARFASQGHAIEAQATGKYRGAAGDCGCMFIQALKAPLTMTATLSEIHLGQLMIERPGTVVAIPFDYATTNGNMSYKLTMHDENSQMSDWVRIVGQMDGMVCGPTSASIAGVPALDAAPAANVDASLFSALTTCPYELANAQNHVSGNFRLLESIKSPPQVPVPAKVIPKGPQ